MLRHGFLFAAVFGVAMAIPAPVGLSLAGDKDCSPNLAERVKVLTDRVSQLEMRVAKLEPTHVTITRSDIDGQRVPKNWQPREFNGLRYYIVPLGAAGP